MRALQPPATRSHTSRARRASEPRNSAFFSLRQFGAWLVVSAMCMPRCVLRLPETHTWPRPPQKAERSCRPSRTADPLWTRQWAFTTEKSLDRMTTSIAASCRANDHPDRYRNAGRRTRTERRRRARDRERTHVLRRLERGHLQSACLCRTRRGKNSSARDTGRRHGPTRHQALLRIARSDISAETTGGPAATHSPRRSSSGGRGRRDNPPHRAQSVSEVRSYRRSGDSAPGLRRFIPAFAPGRASPISGSSWRRP